MEVYMAIYLRSFMYSNTSNLILKEITTRFISYFKIRQNYSFSTGRFYIRLSFLIIESLKIFFLFGEVLGLGMCGEVLGLGVCGFRVRCVWF